jgi:alpha-maltose-1-phosphate synthase
MSETQDENGGRERRSEERCEAAMRVGLLTCEYPPEVYGGAGVHVVQLARELASLTELEVHCFGPERPSEADRNVVAHRFSQQLAGESPHLAALRAMSADLVMAAALSEVDVVHSHTWYTNLAGHLAKLVHDIPHVLTSHSLEPLRPWKAGQLGSGYRVSSFCERVGIESADAVIAVSVAAARDVCRCYPAVDPNRVVVIHNAVDAEVLKPDPGIDVLEGFGIDPDAPIVVYAGRITHQKGIFHLFDAVRDLDPSVQLVLRAGPADTPDLARELAARVAVLADRGRRVIWIQSFVDHRQLAQILTHATVVCCPSVYEPFGLVNVEAMACQTPVVASQVGGIPEVVEHGVTGLLVPFEPVGNSVNEPADPERFARDLAEAINTLVGDPALARQMGRAGRQRVLEAFSWAAAARRTAALYESLLSGAGHPATDHGRRAAETAGAAIRLPAGERVKVPLR